MGLPGRVSGIAGLLVLLDSCSALDPGILRGLGHFRPEHRPVGAAHFGQGAHSGRNDGRGKMGFVGAERMLLGSGSIIHGDQVETRSTSCSFLHGRPSSGLFHATGLGSGGRKGASRGLSTSFGMSLFGRLVIQAERQLVTGLRAQMSRVWGFALAVLPDLLNLVVVGILLYAAVISCGPIFNELLWTPDDAGAPPIEGRKWEDFDKSTRDILRTYKNGDVAPSGNHIEGWNRQVRRRKARLENAVQAARRYKKALEAERSASMKPADPMQGRLQFFKKFLAKLNLVETEQGLVKSAQKAKEAYMKAKADYMQEGTYSASFIRPKRYGTETLTSQTALEQADEKNQEAELQDMLEKLKEMKDQPILGEVVDTTSQFGARSLENLVSAEKDFTRLWPKAVAPDGIHGVIIGQEKESKKSESKLSRISKEDRLKGQRLRNAELAQESGEKTYSVFGTKRTVVLPKDSQDKEERFGIPIMFVIVPSVSLTVIACYHMLSTVVALATAVLSSTLLQSWKPLRIFSAVTSVKLLHAYGMILGFIGGIVNFITGVGTIAEACLMTVADIVASGVGAIFAPMLTIALEVSKSSAIIASGPVAKWLSVLQMSFFPTTSPEIGVPLQPEHVEAEVAVVAFVGSAKPMKFSQRGNLLVVDRRESMGASARDEILSPGGGSIAQESKERVV